MEGVGEGGRQEMNPVKETTEKTKHTPLYISKKSFLSILKTFVIKVRLLKLWRAYSESHVVGPSRRGLWGSDEISDQSASLYFLLKTREKS